MHRLQISLPESQFRHLTERARREGISVAEIIRRLIHHDSKTTAKHAIDSIWKIVGIAKETEPLIDDVPVSEQPDLYIAEHAAAYTRIVGRKSKADGKKRK